MTEIERELRERLAALRPDQQRQVLEYARALGETRCRGVPGQALLSFAGCIPADDLRVMAQTIEEDCGSEDMLGG